MSEFPTLKCSQASLPLGNPWPDQNSRAIVFLDLSVSPVKTLKGLLEAARSSATLRAVLDGCQKGIESEHALLGQRDREAMPSFRTLRDLIHLPEHVISGNAAVSMVLNTTAQLGCFVRLAEREPSLLSTERHGISFVGLCAGTIAAAVAAASTSLTDIISLSETVASLAFRTGLEADQRAWSIYHANRPCTLAVLGKPADELERTLEDFNSQSHIPDHRKAYISAELPTSVTISGPPSTLDLLHSYEVWGEDMKIKPLSISAPFHASHLPCPNIERITNFSELDDFQLRGNVTFVASQCHPPRHNGTLRAVLRDGLTNLFQSRMVLATAAVSRQPPSFWQASDLVTFVEPSGPANNNIRCLGIDEAKACDIASSGVSENANTHHADDEVAIVGMAGRFPNADTLDEYWDIIVSGKDVHQYIPKERFDAQASYDQTASGKNTTASPFGCFMKTPGMFDPAFFNLSPREAKQIDPQHRILLMVTQEALQMSGYSGAGNKRVGTFFGQATDDWRESHTRQDIDIFYVGAGMRAFAPGRLNYHFKWDGPSYSVDTACSASLAALELACKAIRSGDCDLAVAGGGNLCSALPMFSGLSKGRFTSPTGSCKTFCSSADGYCRGEAVGVVVLQRLQDARLQNTNIKGTVAGIVTNHSAYASSITHPHAGAQQTLMLDAIRTSGLNPSDIDYVEFHGTGTKAGDKTEMASVSSVFDEESSRSSPLYVGAVKANVGHGEAAAGITSLIKALLMIRHDTIPPHCGIKSQLSTEVKQAMSTSLEIPQRAIAFPVKQGPKNILINNFNATGGNTCMVLREPPPRPIDCQVTDPRSHWPITVSGQTQKALRNNIALLKEYSGQKSLQKLADLSYTLTARRVHYKYRKAFAAATLGDLEQSLDVCVKSSDLPPAEPLPRVAFVFAGQGTQVQGIGADLFSTSWTFRLMLQRIESLCLSLNLPKFTDFLVGSKQQEWSPVQLQLATVAVELALARLWQSWGVEPSFVVGHSIGEYTALCVAGVISDADLFSLVGRRAQLMEELCQEATHTMLSVQSSPDEIVEIVSKHGLDGCEISCYNSPHAVTMSGPRELLNQLREQTSALNIKSTFLNVKYAFHSPNIEPILEEYEHYAETIPFSAPKIPVVSTLSGIEITEPGTFSARYLANQARKPVRFADALRNSCPSTEDAKSHETIWIEFGPGNPACLSFVRASVPVEHRSDILPSITTRKPTWEDVSHNIAKCFERGINIDWQSYHRDYEEALRLLELPNYAFDLQDLWIPLEDGSQGLQKASEHQKKVTPLLHTLTAYSSSADRSVAEFSSSLNDEFLFDLIQGHFVMGSPLCPSSVYCAMAIDAAEILESKIHSQHSQGEGWTIRRMSIHQPLIPQQKQGQAIRVSASKLGHDDAFSITFTSAVTGKPSVEHAQVSLQRGDPENWAAEWSKIAFLVESRTDQLETLSPDVVLRISKPVIYKLFSHVVAYSQPYQGIQSITLDTAKNEAVADVRFDLAAGAREDTSVHLIDSLMHFAGFVLNNGIENEDDVFISDGLDSLKMLPDLNEGDTYKYYVRLSTDESGQLFSGDVYAFLGDRIVAVGSGVRFHRMKKRSLQTLFSRHASADSTSKETRAAANEQLLPERTNKEHRSEDLIEEEVKQILAKEAGVEKESITSTSSISALGIDSILMMSVLDKIQDKLQILVPSQEATGAANFEAFKAVVLLVGREGSEGSEGSNPAEISKSPRENLVTHAVSKLVDEKLTQAQDYGTELSAKIISVIARLVGVSDEQVEQAGNFSALGIDSLLSIDIVDQIQKETGEEMPTSFLQDNPNAESVRRRFSASAVGISRETSARTSGSITPVYEGSNPSPAPHRRSSVPIEVDGCSKNDLSKKSPGGSRKVSPGSRECKMRLIQGPSRSSAPPIFFLPPGDGTATIYGKLPKHPEDTAIYSPESPFAGEPHHPSNTFGNVSQAYQTAIRRAFPQGPYHIAGYSVGGAYAFEVTRLLLKEGCEVESLTIIDCPAPCAPLENGLWFGLEALIMVGFVDYLLELLPNLTVELLEHTAAAARELNRHVPLAFEANKPGKVSIIWSTHGSQEELIQRCIAEQLLLDKTSALGRSALIERRRREANMSWCHNKRTDLGPQGWDRWVGSDVRYEVVEGTHFSVAVEPTIKSMAELVYRCIGQAGWV